MKSSSPKKQAQTPDQIYSKILNAIVRGEHGFWRENREQLIPKINNPSAGSLPFLVWLLNKLYLVDKKDSRSIVSLIEDLVSSGMSLNVKAMFMKKPVSLLTFVTQFQDIHLVKYISNELIKQAKRPFQLVGNDEEDSFHPVFVSIMKRDEALTQYLIENIEQYSGYTLLSMAAHYGYNRLIDQCIAAGDDLNQIDGFGLTPLMHAGIKQQPYAISSLLKLNAHLLKDEKGATFFHNILKLMRDPLIIPFIAANDLVHHFYDITPELMDKEGLLPIHYAIARGNMDWVTKMLRNNPDLTWVLDNEQRTLVFHAVMKGNLLLLRKLHDEYQLPLDIKDKNQKTLLDYCIDRNLIDIANFLSEKGCVNLTAHPQQLMRAISMKKMVAWCLSHPTVDLGCVDNSSSEGLRPATCSRDPEILLNTQHDCTETDRSGSREQVAGRRDLNCQHALDSNAFDIASSLCLSDQAQYFLELDLFRKHPEMFFIQSTLQRTTSILDMFFISYDPMSLDPEYQQKARDFISYALTYLQETSDRLRLTETHSLDKVIEFCLDKQLIALDDFLENTRIFHLWEMYQYFSYKNSFKDTSFNAYRIDSNESLVEQSERAYKRYQKNIIDFIGKYKPDVNIKDLDGKHIFAHLIRFGTDGINRILWMLHNIQNIKITNLDSHGSSLLHLACEEGLFDMVRWCIEKRTLSILTVRTDGKTALDIALANGNATICTYLIKRLNDETWSRYLSDCGVQERSILENNTFYGRKPRVTSALSEPLPIAVEHSYVERLPADPAILDDAQGARDGDLLIDTAVVTLSEEVTESRVITLNYAMLLEVIQEANISKLKLFKQSHYQEQLVELINDKELVEVFDASKYKYAVIYQLLRYSHIQTLMTMPHWKLLFENSIILGNVRLLFFLLNQEAAQSSIPEFAFELLEKAIALENQALVDELLKHNDFISKASHRDNQCLIEAIKKDLTQVIFRLLNIDAVRLNVHENDNQVLKEAIKANDLETCEELLKIPSVIDVLQANDYAWFNETQELSDDVIELMYSISSLSGFVSFKYPKISSDAEVSPGLLSEHQADTSSPTGYIGALPAVSCFYNPIYYIIVLNEYDFYDAVLAGNADRLQELFMASGGFLNPSFIYHLASCAVINGQLSVLERLFNLAGDVFNSNIFFCNRLVVQALATKQIEIAYFLLRCNMVCLGLHVYQNRLLRQAIRTGHNDFALLLLTFPNVRQHLHTYNYSPLNCSAVLGQIDLLCELLKYPIVDRVNVIFHALSKAYNARQIEVVLYLLDEPGVLEKALKEQDRYDPVIIQFTQRFRREPTRSKHELSILSALLSEYPATRHLFEKNIQDASSAAVSTFFSSVRLTERVQDDSVNEIVSNGVSVVL